MATIVYDGLDGLQWRIAKKTSSAFDGGTLNAHGDVSGTGNPYTLFTVTGDVIISRFWGICNTNLAGATGTIEVGTASNTAKLLAQVTATDLVDGDVYTDAGAEANIDILTPAVGWAINDGADIIETAATADITAGQIDYYCIWAAVEANASVVAA